jgi:selenide,water dikinase
MGLAGKPAFVPEELLVGAENADDAAVYRLTDDLAVVLTVDFFTPIVDSAFDFGRIAAANALSDVYAMGGEPRVVLNLMAFPKMLGVDVAADCMRGSAEVVAQAHAVVAGGHTIEDNEPKFGLCVMGVVDPAHLLKNGGARPGDVLFLTKPVGTGLMTTGLKRGLVSESQIQPTVEQMATLNAAAASVVRKHADLGAVHACTDLTGFGVVGHVHEMAQASGLAARVDLSRLPIIEGARDLARQGVTPGKTRDVRAWAEGFTTIEPEASGMGEDEIWNIVADPQSSGGLLIAVDPDDADAIEADLKEAEAPCAARIAEFVEGPSRITVF